MSTLPRGMLVRPSLFPKRKVFISYHHANEQAYCDWLRTNLSSELEIFTDRSLTEAIRSDDAEYVNRRIREDYILGSSVTIVLCGSETYKRKYVDWEIYSTLHHEHALLGLWLPTAARNTENKILVPNRLYENIESGYAIFEAWNPTIWAQNHAVFTIMLEQAILASQNKSRIRNNTGKMQRNAA
ncbi:MAG TPA: TIR domain-containing protein [Alphaproteobacteria bacterium]|nr:TIR domain-containing protein [Alphaproteobacteria bacterium]